LPLTHTRTPRAHAARALLLLSLLLPAQSSPAQSGRPAARPGPESKTAAPAAPPLKRAATRREVRRLGYGGSVTVYGAPEGSVTVEGWPRAEVEVTAEVELNADTEEDLARLAELNGFVLDEDHNHVRVVTTGTHDRQFLKRAARDLPKRLRAMPWKIDYRVRVPAVCDLEVYAGRGAVTLSGVEGAVRLNAGEGPAAITLAGGDVEATLRGGPVHVRIPARSWRGRGMSVRVVGGAHTRKCVPASPMNSAPTGSRRRIRGGALRGRWPMFVMASACRCGR